MWKKNVFCTKILQIFPFIGNKEGQWVERLIIKFTPWNNTNDFMPFIFTLNDQRPSGVTLKISKFRNEILFDFHTVETRMIKPLQNANVYLTRVGTAFFIASAHHIIGHNKWDISIVGISSAIQIAKNWHIYLSQTAWWPRTFRRSSPSGNNAFKSIIIII